MQLEGRVWKDNKVWLAEVPILDVLTQGKSRKDALNMIREAIELLVNKKMFSVQVGFDRDEEFFVQTNMPALLLALMLKRQRAKQGLSIREVSTRMHATSPNAYAQYEWGKSEPSLSKLEQLIKAIMPNLSLSLSARRSIEA